MKVLKKLIALLLLVLTSSSAFAITNAQLFAYATANYPGIFTGAGTTGIYQQYSYSYYPASGNYLAVDTAGVTYVLGPYTGGLITPVGTLTSFANTVTTWEATQAGATSFPLQSAYKTLIANGLTKNFTVSGTCSGSGTKTSAPVAAGATFEGRAVLSAVATLTMSLSNCTPASTAQTLTSYFDSSYIPMGFNSVGINYGVYLTPPIIPTSVAVGGTAIVGTETLYTDSTKATGNGRWEASYVIEADTSTTAIVNMIAKLYNAAGTLTATEQDRYRIAAVGALIPISADVQYATGLHLILTYY